MVLIVGGAVDGTIGGVLILIILLVVIVLLIRRQPNVDASLSELKVLPVKIWLK